MGKHRAAKREYSGYSVDPKATAGSQDLVESEIRAMLLVAAGSLDRHARSLLPTLIDIRPDPSWSGLTASHRFHFKFLRSVY